MTGEGPERCQGTTAGHAVDGEPLVALEAADRPAGLRAENPVDRSCIGPVQSESNLQRCPVRSACVRRSRRCQADGGAGQGDGTPHGEISPEDTHRCAVR